MFSLPSRDPSLEFALPLLPYLTSSLLLRDESLTYLVEGCLFYVGRTASFLSLLIGLGISLGVSLGNISLLFYLLLLLLSIDWFDSTLFLTYSAELFLSILGITLIGYGLSECIYRLGSWEGRLMKAYFRSSLLFSPILGDCMTCGTSDLRLLAELALLNLPSGRGLLGC